MPSKLIYLDTNLWNRLKEQNINPHELVSALRAKGAELVLSGQTVYELSRTFFGSAPDAAVKGKELFQYLTQYVALGIPCAHDNMQQLHGEVRALNTGAATVIAFYGPDEYQLLEAEVEKLAEGILDERVGEFISGRREFSASTRSEQKSHLDQKEQVRGQLNSVSADQLLGWLEEQIVGDPGAAILAGHLLRIYKDIRTDTAIQNALALLRIAPSRMAKSVVRADLYYNWRCANRGSNPRDLVDDLYHVLNAVYCDIYATAELAQAEYASLILSNATTVAIYDGKLPLGQWLLELVS